MEMRGKMDPEILEIKKMVRCLTFDEIAQDFIVLTELIRMHHPKGMRLIEDFKKTNPGKDDTMYQVKFPSAIVAFHQLIEKKYKDPKMKTAVFMRVLEEVVSRNLHQNV